jgi:hypothetical protein
MVGPSTGLDCEQVTLSGPNRVDITLGDEPADRNPLPIAIGAGALVAVAAAGVAAVRTTTARRSG